MGAVYTAAAYDAAVACFMAAAYAADGLDLLGIHLAPDCQLRMRAQSQRAVGTPHAMWSVWRHRLYGHCKTVPTSRIWCFDTMPLVHPTKDAGDFSSRVQCLLYGHFAPVARQIADVSQPVCMHALMNVYTL